MLVVTMAPPPRRAAVGIPQAAYMIALAAVPTLADGLIGRPSWAWSLIGAALVLSGLLVIRRARGRMLTAPFLMLAFCSVGMIAGLAIDRLSLPPGGLAALCAAGGDGFVDVALRHLDALPAMHSLMLLGGMSTMLYVEWRARRLVGTRCRRAICARAGFNLACNSAMLAGMVGGAWIGPGTLSVLASHWDPDAMIAVMTGGMVWGMVGMMLIYRTGFAISLGRRRPAV
jgi:hypothetical protein